MSEPRTCAYCGGAGWHEPGTPRPVNYCRCKYRAGRMGAFSITGYNTSRQTTVEEIRKTIEEYIGHMDPNTPATFSFSITRLHAESMARADAKRAAKGGAR